MGWIGCPHGDGFRSGWMRRMRMVRSGETSLCAPARRGESGWRGEGWDSERVEDNQRYSARAENWKTREAGLEGRRGNHDDGRGQARFSLRFSRATGSIDHRHPVRRNTRRSWPPEAAELWQSNCGAFLRTSLRIEFRHPVETRYHIASLRFFSILIIIINIGIKDNN